MTLNQYRTSLTAPILVVGIVLASVLPFFYPYHYQPIPHFYNYSYTLLFLFAVLCLCFVIVNFRARFLPVVFIWGGLGIVASIGSVFLEASFDLLAPYLFVWMCVLLLSIYCSNILEGGGADQCCSVCW